MSPTEPFGSRTSCPPSHVWRGLGWWARVWRALGRWSPVSSALPSAASRFAALCSSVSRFACAALGGLAVHLKRISSVLRVRSAHLKRISSVLGVRSVHLKRFSRTLGSARLSQDVSAAAFGEAAGAKYTWPPISCCYRSARSRREGPVVSPARSRRDGLGFGFELEVHARLPILEVRREPALRRRTVLLGRLQWANIS
jgi:hypothetical protein